MRAASAFRQLLSHVITDGVIETTKVHQSYKPSIKEPLLESEEIERILERHPARAHYV